MAFSFFTKRTEYTSKRLRFTARALQVFGVVAGVAITLTAFKFARTLMTGWPPEVRDAYLRRTVLMGIGRCLSFIVIGRALLRRQRLGAYVAIATIGLPLVYELAVFPKNHLPWFVIALSFGLPLTALGLIASVWRELGTVRDSEFAQHGRAPEFVEPFTKRNRGYGESRVAPHALTLRSPSLDSMSLDVRKPSAEHVPAVSAPAAPAQASAHVVTLQSTENF